MTETSRVEGWCPGALRPMESGDGLIVRLRLSGNEVPVALAAEIADWADAYGNGAIDLSSRANLQMRGVSVASLVELGTRLDERGLLDANAEAEAVRNVLVAPFPGAEVRAIAQALERELSRRALLWRLPGKFGFSFDAGPYPVGEARLDVGFEAIDANSLSVRLGGAPQVAFGPIAFGDAVAVAVRIAEAFLAARDDMAPTPRRLREVVAAAGVEAFAARATLPLSAARPPLSARPLSTLLGAQHACNEPFVGVALPFGRLRAHDLRALAKAAERVGASTLLLTPWRALLAPCRADAAAGLVASLSNLDLILDPDDARLNIAACPGAPECLHATTDIRADALALAPLVAHLSGPSPLLHLSGCAKGCAHPSPTRYSVVGAAGAYDLVVDGRPGDAPVARGLPFAALREVLASRAAPSQGAAAE